MEQIENKPVFEFEEMEDVRIIIKAKGKHWSIVPLKDMDREEARQIRIQLMRVILQLHSVVDTALEDINPDELKKRLP